MKTPDDKYWRRKLNAFMHDNPEKALDIKDHELKAFLHSWSDQFEQEDKFDKTADFKASAADRLPFPTFRQFKSPFDSQTTPFFHPLGNIGEMALPLTFDQKFLPEVAHETANDSRIILDQGDPRSQFISRWRHWRQWTCEKDDKFAFLPADTRVPDHTIWNHLSVTTALQGCQEIDPKNKPALLLFSLGPVQPFIAASRSIRDLWSGSYLISYLIATAISEISHDLGPDHIIFPSLWGQPLADLGMSDIYKGAAVRDEELGTVWDFLWDKHDPKSRQHYLLPSLPNRFLALVPASEATQWGQRLQKAVMDKLLQIGESVSDHLKGKSSKSPILDREDSFIPERIAPQLENSLEIAWQSFPVPDTITEAESLARKLLPAQENGQPNPATQSLSTLRKMWGAMPRNHKTGYGMATGTTAWPAFHALITWLHDAVKQTKDFGGPNNPIGNTPGRTQNKDTLTGKEEYVLALPEDEKSTKELSKVLSDGNPHLFKQNEFIGALTLVKRLWHVSWLANNHQSGHGFQLNDFQMPNLHQLALGNPFSNDALEETVGESNKGAYYAVMALDGDEMGKWVSGTKMPKIRGQISKEAKQYYEDTSPEGNDANAFLDFLEMPRPLSPSFHLQFSETLANFSLYAARRIVEAFDGRLIYSGGDDVLALLPAQKALDCADALRAAFRGDTTKLNAIKGVWNGKEKTNETPLFDAQPKRPGTIRLHKDGPMLESDPHGYDLLVPGPAADCSVGIAISHIKSPLQDAVREAQAAEKRAKSECNRAAFAISLIKRSGETIQWASKWSNGALELYRHLSEARSNGDISNRFTYRVIELLEPYKVGESQTHTQDFDTIEIAEVEWRSSLERQCQLKEAEKSAFIENATELFSKYIESIPAAMIAAGKEKVPSESPDAKDVHNAILDGVIGLCQSIAFIERNRS